MNIDFDEDLEKYLLRCSNEDYAEDVDLVCYFLRRRFESGFEPNSGFVKRIGNVVVVLSNAPFVTKVIDSPNQKVYFIRQSLCFKFLKNEKYRARHFLNAEYTRYKEEEELSISSLTGKVLARYGKLHEKNFVHSILYLLRNKEVEPEVDEDRDYYTIKGMLPIMRDELGVLPKETG